MRKSIGLDVSEYQGRIRWSYVDTLEKKYPLHFVFIRATVGKDRKDLQFNIGLAPRKQNDSWCYHYYRPNKIHRTSGTFIKTVPSKGDLPPF
jgi:lysozyme